MVDIGGGSTGIDLEPVMQMRSSACHLDASSYSELFIKHDMPSAYELSLLSAHILAELDRAVSIIKNEKSTPGLVCS